MTDKQLIARLRRMSPRLDMLDCEDVLTAADRIEALTKQRVALARAICGAEDAPGYANAQTAKTLEKVARDWAMGMMERINRTLALEAKLAKAVEALEFYTRDDDGGSIARATLAEIKGESHEALPDLR